MTKAKITVTITLLLLFTTTLHVTAQYKNNLLVWGSGGYSSLLTDAGKIDSKGNVGVGVGGGYELHYKWFRLQVGAEFTFLNAGLQIHDFVHDVYLRDNEGDYYTGHHYFTDNKDMYRMGNINIPLMLGAQFGGFYFLVGGKAGLNLFTNATMSPTLNITGTYDKYIGDFANIPDHNFGESTDQVKNPVTLGFNAALSAEVGFYLPIGESKNIKYRLSFFGDYGLLNVHDNSQSQSLMLNIAESPYYKPALNNLMLTENMKGSVVNPLYVGVKFTVLFGLIDRGDCMCEPYTRARSTSTKGSRAASFFRPKANSTKQARISK